MNQYIESLPESHPIKVLHSQQDQISTKTILECVSFESCNSELYMEYKEENNARQPEQRMSLKDFLISKQHSSYDGQLVHYTRSNLKTEFDNVDKIYRIKDHNVRKQAIKWRDNKTFYKNNTKFYCKHCQKSMDRKHIESCQAIINMPEWSQKFKFSFSKSKENFELRFPNSRHFTRIDYLLNTYQIPLFGRVMEKIEEITDVQSQNGLCCNSEDIVY